VYCDDGDLVLLEAREMGCDYVFELVSTSSNLGGSISIDFGSISKKTKTTITIVIIIVVVILDITAIIILLYLCRHYCSSKRGAVVVG
jgi:hypothetical protein